MIIGEALRRYRKRHNLTTREMAEYTDVSHGTISRIERGKPMDLLSYGLVCYAMGVPVGRYFHDTVNDLAMEE